MSAENIYWDTIQDLTTVDFSWYYDALAGKPVGIHDGIPEPGYFLYLWRSKPTKLLVPVIVYWCRALDKEEPFIDGKPNVIADSRLFAYAYGPNGKVSIDPYSKWTWLAGRPISYDEFKKRISGDVETGSLNETYKQFKAPSETAPLFG